MIESKTIKAPKGTVEYLEGGSGPDLVFLHGAGGITADSPFMEALAAKYHVVAPFLPGYGESEDNPEIRDMLDVTLHTFDVLDALGLHKPLLVGHSLGGMVAAEMAAVAPNDVDRLCLIAAAGLWIDSFPVPDMFSLLPRELPAFLFHDADAGAALMTRNVDMQDPKFLIPFLIRNARQLGMAGKLMFPIPERGLKDRIYRIKAKTVLVWGDSDRMFPAPYAQAFKAAIKGAELVSVPEAGHMVIVEQTAAVIAGLARLG
jgi:pimeloyl-ACP methyl ester carboxylesterase